MHNPTVRSAAARARNRDLKIPVRRQSRVKRDGRRSGRRATKNPRLAIAARPAPGVPEETARNVRRNPGVQYPSHARTRRARTVRIAAATARRATPRAPTATGRAAGSHHGRATLIATAAQANPRETAPAIVRRAATEMPATETPRSAAVQAKPAAPSATAHRVRNARPAPGGARKGKCRCPASSASGSARGLHRASTA
jgi:hypothetical protein